MKQTYEIEIPDEFSDDIRAHKKAGQKTVLAKINVLIDELREHPYSSTGTPEPLKYDKKGQWSRRITKKHRLIYSVDEGKVTVLLIAAFGHYEEK